MELSFAAKSHNAVASSLFANTTSAKFPTISQKSL
uniref:Uncharacterized protein n=1 Tax=Rhizophora mucronata TaxID=61149 RepID=A0A2P2NWN2_RHIMU